MSSSRSTFTTILTASLIQSMPLGGRIRMPRQLFALWGQHKAETRVLDYGGGNDVFCDALRANGFPMAITYDPMVPNFNRRPNDKFELVTCFETIEHLPDPYQALRK
jgi:hypothetical protein